MNVSVMLETARRRQESLSRLLTSAVRVKTDKVLGTSVCA